MRRGLLAIAAVAAMTTVGAARAADSRLGDLTIEHAWARASAAANGAAYMTISTSGKSGDQFVGAKSPVAEKVELHTHIMDGDVMRMRPVKAIDVNVGEPAVLKPGGLHVMLIGLKAPLKAGERFPLTLTFEKAGTVTVEVDVQSVAAGPAGMGEHRRH